MTTRYQASYHTNGRVQAPIPESFKRAKQAEAQKGTNVALHLTEMYGTNSLQEAEMEQIRPTNEGETTFMWVIDCPS